MAALMDLVAGEAKAILLAVSVDDWAGLDDPARFDAHLSLGGGLDPTWLDLFSEACRSVSDATEPRDFLDARGELGGSAVDVGERTVERVDGSWITAVAGVADRDLDRIAGRWVDLLDEEYGALPREEKPWIRTLAADIVAFSRAAASSPDVLFAWSF
jgi:hypothetical protein